MFMQGEIVFGPSAASEDGSTVSPHYLVVLGESSEGVLCMFTRSLKEHRGGNYAFTQAECAAAGFQKPCRFDPSHLVLYPPSTVRVLRKCSGRLTRQMLQRLTKAAIDVKASYTTFKLAA